MKTTKVLLVLNFALLLFAQKALSQCDGSDISGYNLWSACPYPGAQIGVHCKVDGLTLFENGVQISGSLVTSNFWYTVGPFYDSGEGGHFKLELKKGNLVCSTYEFDLYAPTQCMIDDDGDRDILKFTYHGCPEQGFCGPGEMPADWDYVLAWGDCDDNDATVNYLATEICDGKDNNCDGKIDEGLPGKTFYKDADGDGYGTSSSTISACAAPKGYSDKNNDCNDSDPLINPGASEVCDGKDNNCNAQVDENVKKKCYVDADHDGYTPSLTNVSRCTCLTNESDQVDLLKLDCADGDNTVNPAASEICDGKDNNCAGGVDEGTTKKKCYTDVDHDTYALSWSFIERCQCLANETDNPNKFILDCRDDNPEIYDKDKLWYLDADRDGYYIKTQNACEKPGPDWYPFATAKYDCDDKDNMAHDTVKFYLDHDHDGYHKEAKYFCHINYLGSDWVRNSVGVDCDDYDPNKNKNKCDGIPKITPLETVNACEQDFKLEWYDPTACFGNLFVAIIELEPGNSNPLPNSGQQLGNFSIPLSSPIYFQVPSPSTPNSEFYVSLVYEGGGTCHSSTNVPLPRKCPASSDPCVIIECVNGNCSQTSKCDDHDETTKDECLNGVCRHTKDDICQNNSDCNDNNPCTIDECLPDNQGNKHCNYTERNCDDNNSCTIDECTNGECTHLKIEGCCQSNADCGDGLKSTIDYCDNNQCFHKLITCEMPCTIGKLVDENGPVPCEYTPIPNCCTSDADCNKYNDLCNYYVCSDQKCSGPYPRNNCISNDLCFNEYCIDNACRPKPKCSESEICQDGNCIIPPPPPPAPPASVKYAAQMNGPNPEAVKVAADNKGNAYVVGEFILTATFNSTAITSTGGKDIFIAKYDSSGALLWVTSAGGEADDIAADITSDSAGNYIYITGNCKGAALSCLSPSASPINLTTVGSSDFFVARMNAENGNFTAAQMSGATSIGNKSDKISSGIGISPDGTGIYVCGGISAIGNGAFGANTIPEQIFCDTQSVAFLAKYDVNCNLLEVVMPENYGGNCTNAKMTDLFVQPSSASQNANHIFVSGYVKGIIKIGFNFIGSLGETTPFYAEYSPDFLSGNYLPVRANSVINGGGKSTEITVTDSGYVYLLHSIIAGDLLACDAIIGAGGKDAYITKFNKGVSGECLWNKTLATSGNDEFSGIAKGKNDTIYVVGSTNDSPNNGFIGFANQGGYDGFIIKYDKNGNPLLIRGIGGAGDDYTYGIATNNNNGVYIVGSFTNSIIDLDNYILNSTDETDGYIISLNELSIPTPNCDDGNPCTVDTYSNSICIHTLTPNSNTETCNGLDDNCNGQIDEGVGITFYKDADGDNYGNQNISTQSCTTPAGFTLNNTDCNDGNPFINPGFLEVCNGIDDNCNGSIDEGVLLTFYRDADDDHYGDVSVFSEACAGPIGYVADNTDCNDNNSSIYPGKTESCNGLDDDCNGQIDEGVLLTFYRDTDGDHYGDVNVFGEACAAPIGYVADNTDCNDNNSSIYPGKAESCNGLDDDCNGQIDEGVLLTFYLDADSDHYGDANIFSEACATPIGYVADNTDCNDNNSSIYPGKAESCNGFDDNCNAQIDEGVLLTFYRDADGDHFGDVNVFSEACAAPIGYVADNTDCNDNNSSIYPGKAETCNGFDDNCNGLIDEGVGTTYYKDADGDNYGNVNVSTQSCTTPLGFTLNNTDCNDNNPLINPGSVEVCNGIDDNCNGSIDEGVKTTYYRDADADGYGNAGITANACSMPTGYVSNNTDCNDANSLINPRSVEVCNGIDDNCNGSIDEGAKKPPTSAIQGPSVVCTNQTGLYFSADRYPYMTYLWNLNNATIDSGQGGYRIRATWGTKKGTVSVQLASTSRCGAGQKTTINVALGACATARIEEGTSIETSAADNKQLNAYPNPTKGNITVEFASESNMDYFIRIYNTMGQAIISKDVLAVQGLNKMEFDLGIYAEGIYLVELRSENGILQRKLMISR